MQKALLRFLLCLGLGTGPAHALEPPLAPEAIEGVQKVNAEGLIALAQQHTDLVMLDARIASNRGHGYIEGSRSLPDVETDCKSLARELPSLDSKVLFYCNGVKCQRSAKAIGIAKECGYTDLYWFRGGFEEWKAKGYPYLRE